MTIEDKSDMSNCTEKLPLKITVDDHAALRKLAIAHGVDMQSKAREYIHAGIARDYQVNTVLQRLRHGEEPVGNSSGIAGTGRGGPRGGTP